MCSSGKIWWLYFYYYIYQSLHHSCSFTTTHRTCWPKSRAASEAAKPVRQFAPGHDWWLMVKGSWLDLKIISDNELMISNWLIILSDPIDIVNDCPGSDLWLMTVANTKSILINDDSRPWGILVVRHSQFIFTMIMGNQRDHNQDNPSIYTQRMWRMVEGWLKPPRTQGRTHCLDSGYRARCPGQPINVGSHPHHLDREGDSVRPAIGFNSLLGWNQVGECFPMPPSPCPGIAWRIPVWHVDNGSTDENRCKTPSNTENTPPVGSH